MRRRSGDEYCYPTCSPTNDQLGLQKHAELARKTAGARVRPSNKRLLKVTQNDAGQENGPKTKRRRPSQVL